MPKTTLAIVLAIIVVLTASWLVVRQLYPKESHFACSDYCPGPASDYTVNVYKGVQNKYWCTFLGGEFKIYYGWGTYKICVVK